ncbi:MAG: hypothetical protein ACRBBK_05830 [Paracoccaceae bacterium]
MTMLEKARANRIQAIRMHALRTADITNVFTSLEEVEAEITAHIAEQGNAPEQHRTYFPAFISSRHEAMVQSHAA